MKLATLLPAIPVLFSGWYTPVRRTDTMFHSRTDSRALRAEYCIVGIQHNTAIQLIQMDLQNNSPEILFITIYF